ncbi:CD209 antigen-like protein D [Danio aesculapii]|uniref:CD209 antigen-like protein D n=1 Tax=Danio aesculapii TaxID=1142201 RepID=UPI0024C009BD|nr:CD209 antigen-like protein D [Danio aesculapii]
MYGFVNNGMDKGSSMESDDRIEQIVDIYITAEAVRNMKHGNNTKDFDTQISETQTPQHTGRNSVKNRSSKAALVCLVLLCFLLLTAVIVLGVFIYTNNTNYTEERRQLRTNITNITEDRDKFLTIITNITEDRKQLLSNITNLTEERNQLVTSNTNLKEKRNQLVTNITNLSKERTQLLTNITNFTEERKELFQNIRNLSLVNDQLKLKNHNLLKKIHIVDGWTYNQSSFYYKSSITKTLNASRSDCIARGADLIIINNSEEQDFVKRMSGGAAVWIGLNDIVAEGTWRWVDGSTLNSGLRLWVSETREPNGGTGENCVVSVGKASEWPTLSGWLDISCDRAFQWICEMNITQLMHNLSDN